MEITRKTDYALRMLAELVEAGEGAVVSVRQVAEHNDIPYSFARSIQHDLVLAGVVESTRGSRGGMTLKADPHDLTICDVIEAVQGPICVSGCDTAGEDGGPCPRMSGCHFNPLWRQTERMVRSFFSSVTLWDVVVDHKYPALPADTEFEIRYSDDRGRKKLQEGSVAASARKPERLDAADRAARPHAEARGEAAASDWRDDEIDRLMDELAG